MARASEEVLRDDQERARQALGGGDGDRRPRSHHVRGAGVVRGHRHLGLVN